MLLAATTTVVVERGGNASADWLTAIGTLGATAVALALGFGLKEWVFRPRLRLLFSTQIPSDRVLTSTVIGVISAWVRVRVRNDGRATAKRARVSLLGIDRWTNDQWESTAPEVVGAEFCWSNRGGDLVRDIPPKSERPLDVFSILGELARQGDIPMELAIGPVVPANASHRLPPGGWRLQLETSADNAPPRVFHLAFRFDGNWPGGDDFWRAVAVDGPYASPPSRPPIPELRDPQEMLREAVQEEAVPPNDRPD